MSACSTFGLGWVPLLTLWSPVPFVIIRGEILVSQLLLPQWQTVVICWSSYLPVISSCHSFCSFVIFFLFPNRSGSMRNLQNYTQKLLVLQFLSIVKSSECLWMKCNFCVSSEPAAAGSGGNAQGLSLSRHVQWLTCFPCPLVVRRGHTQVAGPLKRWKGVSRPKGPCTLWQCLRAGIKLMASGQSRPSLR